MYAVLNAYIYSWIAARVNTLHATQNYKRNYLPYQPHNVPYQACLQRQGTLAAALPPPLALLCSLLHGAAAGCLPAQYKAKSDVSLPHQHDLRVALRVCAF